MGGREKVCVVWASVCVCVCVGGGGGGGGGGVVVSDFLDKKSIFFVEGGGVGGREGRG